MKNSLLLKYFTQEEIDSIATHKNGVCSMTEEQLERWTNYLDELETRRVETQTVGHSSITQVYE